MGKETDAAVNARIRSGWKKFRDMSGVLCRKGMSLRMKGELLGLPVARCDLSLLASGNWEDSKHSNTFFLPDAL